MTGVFTYPLFRILPITVSIFAGLHIIWSPANRHFTKQQLLTSQPAVIGLDTGLWAFWATLVVIVMSCDVRSGHRRSVQVRSGHDHWVKWSYTLAQTGGEKYKKIKDFSQCQGYSSLLPSCAWGSNSAEMLRAGYFYFISNFEWTNIFNFSLFRITFDKRIILAQRRKWREDEEKKF